MRYETVKDLLDHATGLHRGLADYYHRLADENRREKARMLLEYLSRHEAGLATALERFSDEVAASVRDAWFRYPLEEEFVKCIPPARPVAEMGTDEIVNLAIQLDDCIADLYQVVALRSELPAVREVFNSLVAQERQEKMRMVRQAMRLDDL